MDREVEGASVKTGNCFLSAFLESLFRSWKGFPREFFPKNVQTSVVGELILRNSFLQQVCWEFSPNLSLIFFFLLERPLQRSENDTKNRQNQPYKTRCITISFYIRQKNAAAYFSVEINLKFLFYSIKHLTRLNLINVFLRRNLNILKVGYWKYLNRGNRNFHHLSGSYYQTRYFIGSWVEETVKKKRWGEPAFNFGNLLWLSLNESLVLANFFNQFLLPFVSASLVPTCSRLFFFLSPSIAKPFS